MPKPTITKAWLAGLVVLVAGLIVGGVSLGFMLALGGHFVPAPSGNGYDFVPTLDGFFWTMLGLTIGGFVIAAIGGTVQLVAWIGALVNTYRLEDRTWFVVLLVGGLVGLGFALAGFAAMVAYLIAGPDGLTREQPPRTTESMPRPTALAPSS